MNIIETSLLIKAAADNPLFALLIVVIPTYMVTRALLLVWSRFIRHLNIRSQGWPPPHLDADGDAVDYTTPSEESHEN